MKRLFIFLIIILGACFSIWPMEEERPKITITTSDESVFEIDPKLQQLISKYSQTINDVLSEALEKKEEEIAIVKQLLEEGKEVEPVEPIAIPLLTISPENFGFVLSALKNHHEKHVNEEITHEELVERLQQDLTNLSANQLIDMIQTANYLDMQYLLQAATELFAKKAYTELIDRFSSKEGYIELKSLLAQLPIEIQQIMTFGPLGIIKFAPESWSNLIKKFQIFFSTKELPVARYIEWSPDGTKLVFDQKDKAVVENSTTNEKIAEIEGIFHKIYWSPDSSKLALQGETETIIWDLIINEKIAKIDIDFYEGATWSSDSTKFALIGLNNAIIWDATNKKEVELIGSFDEVSWSPDSTKLALIESANVIIWDATNKKEVELKGRFDEISWSPDSTKLALAREGKEKIWNSVINKEIDAIDGNFFDASWSADGTKLVLVGRDKIIIWNSKTNKEMSKIKGSNLLPASWNINRTKFVILEQNKATIWDSKTNEKIAKIKGDFYGVSWGPDGNKLILKGEDAAIVWNLITNKEIAEIKGDYGIHTSLNGAKVVLRGKDKTIIWDFTINQTIAEIDDRFYLIFGNPDSTKFALISKDKSIIWKFDPILMSFNLLQVLFIVWLDKENITKKDDIPKYLQELFDSLPPRIKEKIEEGKEE